jgi:hypothetical protein
MTWPRDPCLCGAEDCPRCYPEIGRRERLRRDEETADYKRDKRIDDELTEDDDD